MELPQPTPIKILESEKKQMQCCTHKFVKGLLKKALLSTESEVILSDVPETQKPMKQQFMIKIMFAD